MSRLALNILTILLITLPVIAPMLPVAKAQTVYAEIINCTNCVSVINNTYAVVTIGSEITFLIHDDDGLTYNWENITANITVNGVLNTVNVGFYGIYGDYVGKLVVEQVGGLIKVRYYYYDNATDSFVDMGYLNGTITATNQTIVIEYKGAKITLVYQQPLATYTLEIYGRLHEGKYWLPRLGDDGVNNITALYNALGEWRIKADQPVFTPGNNYTVTLYARLVGETTPLLTQDVVFTASDEYTLVPANATEAEKIKSFLLNLSSAVNPWYIEGIDFANPTMMGDMLKLKAEIQGFGETAEVDAVIFVSIAKIEIDSAGFNNPEVTITVYDADTNLDTTAAEATPFTFDILVNGVPVMQLQLQETGANTGVFTATTNMFDLYSFGVISETDNVIDYNFTEVRVDDPSAKVICFRGGSFTVTYYAAEFSVKEEQLTLRNIIQCCPPLKLTLQIIDEDLNLPNQEIVAIATLNAGDSLTNVVAYYYYNDQITTVPALNFSMYMADEEGNLYDLTVREQFTIYFIKVAPGVVEASIDLSKIDWQATNAAASAAGHQLTKIVIVYSDRFNPNLTIVNKQAEVTLQNVTIQVDRDTLPISFRIVSSNNPPRIGLGSCPACAAWEVDTWSDVSAQTVHITIYDDGHNEDCCSVDVITPAEIELTLYKVVDGQTVVFGSGTGSLSIDLYAINATGHWVDYGTCYIEVSDLVETGFNTGVFTGTLSIYSEIDVDLDGTPDITIAGCPSLWLQGATLEIKYTSPAVGFAVQKITFATYTAKLQLNTHVVHYGDELVITVEDPDANLDSTINEAIKATLSFYCPLTRTTEEYTVYLKETGTNTGVFVGSITIDSRLAGPCVDLYCAELTVTYVDRTPFDENTLNYAEQLLKQNLSTYGVNGLMIFSECDCNKVLITDTIVEQPVKGSVEVYYKFPAGLEQLAPWNKVWQKVTNDVVPAYEGIELNITVYDPDRNRLYDVVDNIPYSKIAVTIEGLNAPPLILEQLVGSGYLTETGANTGTFSTVITLGDLLAGFQRLGYNVDLTSVIGKKIAFIYYDDQTACQAAICGSYTGGSTSVWIKPVDIEGGVTVINAVTGKPNPDNIYNCGCTIGSCPSATGDIIDIIVNDVSLLKYVQAGGIRLVGNLTLRLLYNNTEQPLTYGGLETLSYIGYENLTLPGSNVVIPVPKFAAENVLIYCSVPLATAGQPYIVAPVGSRVKIIYHDPAIEAGTAKDVEVTIGIGVPGLLPTPEQSVQFVEQQLEVRVFNGTAFVETTTVKRGQPVSIYVPLNYDALTVRTYTGANVFTVLLVIKDAEGKVALFTYTYIDVSKMENEVSFGIPAEFTKLLPAGTYTVELYAVTSLDALMPLSPVLSFQLTITE
ncbi:hypothetical protein [Hyperthermus butylicus]|uniref:Uncharacterized protein n=1 Tax=Hyperthermus butylicus (strain DSM 5456 / JCM 9403 / PLM1-5) TaxID=415426 RepID=A2BLH8_HYPBU|nr:hypothetical protein [Hyperthermus butylicus]ABM80839.1 hypothetical protein Hbut_0992 [Hyperthermus butylicus DSM 5456]